MLGHAGGDVGVMVLYADHCETAPRRPLLRPAGGEITGVQVVDDGVRFDLKGMHQVSQRVFEELKAAEIFKIPEMLTLVGKAAAGQGEDVLEVTADGEQRGSFDRQR